MDWNLRDTARKQMNRAIATFLAMLLTLACVQDSRAGLVVGAYLAPSASPWGGFSDFVQASDPQSVNITQSVSYPSGELGFGPQEFNGSASASATPDTFKLDVQASLHAYERRNYGVFTTQTQAGDDFNFVYAAALAGIDLSDELTISSAGGAGVYSLNYLLGLDGFIENTTGDLLSYLSISLYMPEGIGEVTSYVFGPSDVIPSQITISYRDLPFGQPIHPTLSITALVVPVAITEYELGYLGSDLINGSGEVRFGSTVHLLGLSATDESGNLIPGLTLHSAESYQYSTDPSNLLLTPTAVPEPGSLTLAGLGVLGLLAARLRQRNGVV